MPVITSPHKKLGRSIFDRTINTDSAEDKLVKASGKLALPISPMQTAHPRDIISQTTAIILDLPISLSS